MSKENEKSSIEVEIETPESEEVVETEESGVSELEEMRALVASWEDKFLRTHASFENSKRLLGKDKAAAVAYANESFAKDMLSVVDSFDSALAMISATDDEDGSDAVLGKIKEGLDLTYGQLTKVLEKNGIKAIDSEGEFDPEVHQAIMQIDSEEHEAGQIVQVLQKGYTIKERVLRPAMVSTAK
ncbi:nucleotide exchange factor GrpE [Sulfurovum sp. bin170]|uniref:nucleotide exchange factor GrpE n=1 Tax=Sulfurovum sp. bin170 TaxID=2695268 RepID=UPI0013DEEB5F|nr:nucleotide exchange factor GrpE [Sulfurovum sp. bin170]NEW61688.1 nucleotide exchange factor GrpE [Sulfurovum sp. bin170]